MKAYVIDFAPESSQVDIVPRIKEGVRLAQNDGVDFVFILEDDDFYSFNYIKEYGDLSEIDFCGYSSSIYYNIFTRTYEILKHSGRSSLCCTGFRINALIGKNEDFTWPSAATKFLDIDLWTYATENKKRIKLLPDPIVVGIKGHKQGMAAGKGHVMHLKNQDHDLHFLSQLVDESAMEFYKELMKKL